MRKLVGRLRKIPCESHRSLEMQSSYDHSIMPWFWQFVYGLGRLVENTVPLVRDYIIRIVYIGVRAAANQVIADVVDAIPRIARSLLRRVGLLVDDTEG